MSLHPVPSMSVAESWSLIQCQVGFFVLSNRAINMAVLEGFVATYPRSECW